MNSNAQRINDALAEYKSAKVRTEKEIKRIGEVYRPDWAGELQEDERKKLQNARAKAAQEIEAAYKAGVEATEYWGKLYGGKITDDIELLKNDLVDPAQFDQLKDRYYDNATMLTALKKYGERRNAEAIAAENAGAAPVLDRFNTKDIATLPDRLKNWDAVRAQALDMLDATDGTGKYKGEYEVDGRIWSDELIGKIGEGVAL